MLIVASYNVRGLPNNGGTHLQLSRLKQIGHLGEMKVCKLQKQNMPHVGIEYSRSQPYKNRRIASSHSIVRQKTVLPFIH